MAAAIVAPVTDAAEEGVEAVQEKLDELGRNPAQFISDGLIKWGTIVFIGGIAAWAISLASTRAARGYIIDIDNTLGIPQETQPTPPRKVLPAPVPPPPTIPPQISLLNQIVSDINTLGTTNASQNVALLQDVLTQLWNLATFMYRPSPNATDFPPQATGSQLAIAIMQTATLIYDLEGQTIPSDSQWTWEYYTSNQVQVYSPNGGAVDAFLQGITATAMGPFVLDAVPNWGAALNMLSSTASNDNYKTTINGLAAGLNATQPFNVQAAAGPNPWGPLGTVVSDLSALGSTIVEGAETVGDDIENAVVTFGDDVKGAFGEIGQGLAFIGKAILNMPRLTFDALGYGLSWGAEMVLDAIYIPLLAIGGGMVAGGLALRWGYRSFWPNLKPRLELKSNAAQASFWARFDRRFHIPADIKGVNALATRKVAIEKANARVDTKVVPPVEVATPPAPAQGTSPPTPEVPPAAPAAPDVSEPVPAPENAPAGPGEVRQPSDKSEEAPVPGGSTTEETEAYLGENPTRAPTPEELKAQEAERLRSMPEPGPTYAQRKEEREHEEAERLLSLGEEWGET